ncbi:hypothetical protein H0V99_00500 [Candidatus Saccharibacteria bacterium]|nr:hypothetical protein [Candidatus Saccharibacteria bacterium]
MKQQDVAVIIAIVFFAGVFSVVLSNKFISPPSSKRTAEVVQPITADFVLPSTDVFNATAENPTRLIEIAPNANNQPFADANN